MSSADLVGVAQSMVAIVQQMAGEAANGGANDNEELEE